MLKWENLTEQQIDKLFDDLIEEIFKDEDINNMSKFEKRRKIYNYLIENEEYDDEYYEKVFNNFHEKDWRKIFPRNQGQEFISPIVEKKGVCNGFAQSYKVLLEKVGVYSMCLVCAVEYKNEYVGHQLNLVYDDEFDTYSFDDVNFGIETKTEEFFNYENPEEKGQGIGTFNDVKWMFLNEEAVNEHAKRDHSPIRVPRNLMPLIENLENWIFDNPKELQKYGVLIKKTDNCDIISRRR